MESPAPEPRAVLRRAVHDGRDGLRLQRGRQLSRGAERRVPRCRRPLLHHTRVAARRTPSNRGVARLPCVPRVTICWLSVPFPRRHGTHLLQAGARLAFWISGLDQTLCLSPHSGRSTSSINPRKLFSEFFLRIFTPFVKTKLISQS